MCIFCVIGGLLTKKNVKINLSVFRLVTSSFWIFSPWVLCCWLYSPAGREGEAAWGREGPQALYTSHRGKCVAREVYKFLPLFTRLHNRINSLAINAGGNIWPSALTRSALPVKRGHERQLAAQGRLHLCVYFCPWRRSSRSDETCLNWEDCSSPLSACFIVCLLYDRPPGAMYASGYSEVSKYSPQTKKKMQYHSKGKSCGYYMRIVFFFSSLIQSLIIVSLVLFLIYGKDQDSASTSRIQDLEESFSRLSIENVALRQQRKNLTNLLNRTLTEKARNDWDLYRLRVFSNISASIIQDQEKRIVSNMVAFHMHVHFF